MHALYNHSLVLLRKKKSFAYDSMPCLPLSDKNLQYTAQLDGKMLKWYNWLQQRLTPDKPSSKKEYSNEGNTKEKATPFLSLAGENYCILCKQRTNPTLTSCDDAT